MLKKIVSGGQTGVDRGALDAALGVGFPCGGWCPEGRVAEDGRIADRYPVTELASAGYRRRTRQNVIDSDGTLVICFDAPTGGTLETVRFCDRFKKPVLVIDAAATDPPAAAALTAEFVKAHSIAVLNVAGPRESTRAGASNFSRAVVAILVAQ
ncbi:MAG: putative molybdenum carrier protein [Betaproteobacteria bacterium]|nr:putative molybdenum carrier protein [Betaproteobacteria bacterium]